MTPVTQQSDDFLITHNPEIMADLGEAMDVGNVEASPATDVFVRLDIGENGLPQSVDWEQP